MKLTAIFFLMLALLCSYFGSKSQSDCDSLEIVSIQYAHFKDSLVMVTVKNNSQQIFSYPSFTLIDQLGDTIAYEIVNFFGIGQMQTHQLITNGNSLMNSYPQAHLELWMGFSDSLICSFDRDVDLCPTDSCSPVHISVGNFGGALAFANYDWEIKDSSGNILENGQLVLDTQQYDKDTICLSPGNYSLSMTVSNVTGGQVYIGIVGPPDAYSGIQEPINFNGNEVPFTLFNHCINIVDGIDEVRKENPIQISRSGDLLIVRHSSNKPLEELLIFDSAGNEIVRIYSSNSEAKIDMTSFAKGTYILTTKTANHKYTRKFLNY